MSNQYKGYAAIDDVQLILDKCAPQQVCDFESEDICGYFNDPSGDINWSRITGETSVFPDSVILDHTYQTQDGHYMAIEKNDDSSEFILH